MRLKPSAFNVLSLISLLLLTGALACYVSYKSDIRHLRHIVRTQITTGNDPDVFEALNHWVYENKGFKKNPNYFLFKPLGPTPIQVLNEGGDCTDKSLLLITMLDSIGIDSTLVMLYSADGETATHTVVEVRDGQFKAVADPVFDMVFPKLIGGHYSVGELRENPAILLNRLDHLVDERGRNNKVAKYRRANETYQFATTINWDKLKVLQVMSELLGKFGIDARDIRRPHFLDDPKLFTATVLFAFSVVFLTLALALRGKWGRLTRDQA